MDLDLLEPDPIAADARRGRRRTLIPDEACCVLCGLAHPDALEDDHVLGWRADDDVRVWLCKSCHAIQTATRHDHQAGTPAGPRTHEPSLPERLARALRSLGVFLAALGDAVIRWAEQLIAFAVGLDEYAPEWRHEVWAR